MVHALPILLGQRRDAPHHFAPRLEAVFFSSRRTVSRLIALNPGSAIDYANIASNYRDLGKTEEAIHYYELALSLDPSIDFARNNLAKLLS